MDARAVARQTASPELTKAAAEVLRLEDALRRLRRRAQIECRWAPAGTSGRLICVWRTI